MLNKSLLLVVFFLLAIFTHAIPIPSGSHLRHRDDFDLFPFGTVNPGTNPNPPKPNPPKPDDGHHETNNDGTPAGSDPSPIPNSGGNTPPPNTGNEPPVNTNTGSTNTEENGSPDTTDDDTDFGTDYEWDWDWEGHDYTSEAYDYHEST